MATVAVGMNLMPPKVIGRETCLCARGPFGLSKDLGPKKRPNIWKREESNVVRDFMKVKKGSVHCKIYEGRARNNELEFQRPPEHHPFYGENPHVEHFLIRHF